MLSRRGFLGAAGGVWIAGRAGARPAEKLRIACIGTGGRGAAGLTLAKAEALVAICDVDDRNLDRASSQHPEARKYSDYRELFEAEKDLDAVIVSTPDHHHAPASLLALKRGKHVYCEKPLAHSVYETRLMAELAARSRAVTQEGTQGHATDARRRVVEILQSGAIGPVTEVHAWSNRPIWPTAIDRPSDAPAVPAHLKWDLWLGPSPERPYHSAYVPFKWRGWWDFGNGAISDMGSHQLDAAFWALRLRWPTVVEAEGPPPHAESTPPWMIVRYQFPGRGDQPPLKLTWYDGQRKPPAELFQGIAPSTSGTIFVGAEGTMILQNEQGSLYKLLPEAKFADYKPPEPTLPRVAGQSGYAEWIAACKGEGKALCGFAEAGPMAEAILLGTVAYRAGRKLEWNGASLRVTNDGAADRLIRPPARKGWTLPPRPGIGMYK